MNRGSIYNPSFKTNHYVPLRGDRMLRSVLPATEQLSCDRTLTSVRSALTGVRSALTGVRSALTGHVQSQKLLSRTLLMLTRLWHPVSGHFVAQRLVTSRKLTSIWSAMTGRVRSGFSLSGTLLELTELWHLASGHISLSVWSQPDGSS